MYDTPPVYNFPGSSMPQLPTTMDQINPGYYYQIADFIKNKGGRLASVNGVVLYDTQRVDAGVLPTRDVVFFQNPVGATQQLLVAGTNYIKQEIDVSPMLVTGGQLAQGYECLIWSIGVQFHIVSALDDTVQTTGNAINLPLAPGSVTSEVAADPIKMGNLLRAAQESFYFQLFVNQTRFEDGPGWRFPAGGYGGSGFASMCSGATAPAFAVTDGYINNGFGFSYQMPVMRHLPPLTKFGVRMSIQNPFDTTAVGPFRVVVTLEGIGLQPITG